VTTLDNRIAQRESTLRLLEEDINRRATDLHDAPASTLDTLGAKAELQQLEQVRAGSGALLEGLRKLRSAEAERLALAEERLALLRSRAELRTIYEHGGFDKDPRVVAIRAIISRLARDAVRLDNEAGAARPRSAPDPARKGLLQLQAGDAIIRSSVRVGDLELLRLADQLDSYGDLIGDDSIPVPILDEARGDLDNQRARLDERLAALDGDRLTLAGQRELIRAQAADSKDAGAMLLGPVDDLAELLDALQTDVTRLQQRLGDVAARLDVEIGRRELGALRERRALPTNVGHWDVVKSDLIQLPQMTVKYWRGILSDVAARLVALPARSLVSLGAAILVLCGALGWLYRTGLERLALLSPVGKSGVPLEGLRRSLPLFMPVVIWMVIARTVGVAERPASLLAGALGLLPLAGFMIHLSTLLFADASDARTSRRRLHSLARWAVLAVVTAAALGLLVRSVPVLPSVADLIDRAGFAGLLLAAIATWLLRQDLLYSVRDKIPRRGPVVWLPPRPTWCLA
jgi:hypothetical protein